MYLECDEGYSTLAHLAGVREVVGRNGGDGGRQGMEGPYGKDVVIQVPVGTEIVWRRRGGDEWTRLGVVRQGERVAVAQGGGGGYGNVRFASPTNRAPLLAEVGEYGDEVDLILEMTFVADVGVVGKPNAGKSTLLAAVSAARPKVGDYPFTTIVPTIGVVTLGDQVFTMMEIPGLIKDSHSGRGLGEQLLRYAQKVQAIVYLVDGSSEEPAQDFAMLREELRLYDAAILEKPAILVVNKLDLPEVRTEATTLARDLASIGLPVHLISAATGEGVEALVVKTGGLLAGIPPREHEASAATARRITVPRRQGERIHIQQERDVFVVYSARARRVAERVSLDDWLVKVQFVQYLRKLGVARLLEKAGVKPGTRVQFGKAEMKW